LTHALSSNDYAEMHARFPRLRCEDGFTLPELIIGIAIVSLLVGAIGSALIVSFRTTDVTSARFEESHDAQITSAYLANDVQSAGSVKVPGGSSCTASTRLVDFKYAGGLTASYFCGPSGGETQVTRTYNSDTVVVAHFAGTGLPQVTCSPSPCSTTGTGAGSTPDLVTIAFTETNPITRLNDFSYTLVGSRRTYTTNPAAGGTLPADITLLSTGTSSPLWIQGSCPDPGTSLSTACNFDPDNGTYVGLPKSDVATADWAPTPLSDQLKDRNPSTFVTNTAGKSTEARVLLSAVSAPTNGFLPTVEFQVASKSADTGTPKVTLSLYDGSTLLVQGSEFTVNKTGNLDWNLKSSEATKIPATSYAHLTLGFSVSSAKASNAHTVSAGGVAIDTAAPNGLLTIKGSLYVNSSVANDAAVRLTGSKTEPKLTVTTGDFEIQQGSGCAGCNSKTVPCQGCLPWKSYSPAIPDPLRSLPPPARPTTDGSCSGSAPITCTPGLYKAKLSIASDTNFAPGVYYLEQGISVTGSAALCSLGSPCTDVMLYIAGGSASFAGNGTINLKAPSSGVYTGISVFQADGRPGGPVADNNEFKVTGNSGSGTTNDFGGIVYVPSSNQVTLATGTSSITAKAIIAQNIKVTSAVAIG
jgi:prepilin-type N-terminal cleavage/methylation domain-containing protein